MSQVLLRALLTACGSRRTYHQNVFMHDTCFNRATCVSYLRVWSYPQHNGLQVTIFQGTMTSFETEGDHSGYSDSISPVVVVRVITVIRNGCRDTTCRA